MIRIVVLLGLVACYSPSYKDCEVTCSSGTCPAGYRCEQGMCRAPGFSGACGQMNGDTLDDTMMADAMIDGNPNLDSDGDGVMDNVDNCIMKANANQANEDSDMRGDACDPCPPLSQFINPMTNVMENADADFDGDGVGNGCDILFMNSSGDRIVMFEGFGANTMPMDTVIEGSAAWTFNNRQARVNTGNGVSTLRFMNYQLDPARREIIQTNMTINSVLGGSTMIRGGGLVDSSNGVRAAGCYWGSESGGQEEMVLVDIQGPMQDVPLVMTVLSTMFTPPQTNRMTLMRDPNSTRYTCQLSNDASQPPLTLNFGPAPMGNVGLRVRTSDTTFDWILVVDRLN